MKKDNITLIGMSGVGKSTIGKLLAKKFEFDFEFIDCDQYIIEREKTSLQKIIDMKGYKHFLKVEEKRILELLPLKNCIISPGGSIIYSSKVMNLLQNSSIILFLDLPLKIIEQHLANKETRGIVGLKDKSFRNLYNERLLLYKKYGDIKISCFQKSKTEIVKEIIGLMNDYV